MKLSRPSPPDSFARDDEMTNRSRGAFRVRVLLNQHQAACKKSCLRMISKSGHRFSNKIMRKKRRERSADRRIQPWPTASPWSLRPCRRRVGGSAARHERSACANHSPRARSPFGAPLRRLPRRANAGSQSRPRFTRAGGCRRYPHRQSRLSQAPGAPVVMPEGTLPKPPGSGLRNRPQEPHSLHTSDRIRNAPFAERDSMSTNN